MRCRLAAAPACSAGSSGCSTPDTSASPNCTVRRSAAGLSPPTQIGGCGCDTGFGMNTTLWKFAYLPASAGRSCVHSVFHACRYSSVTAPRSLERRRAERGKFLAHPAGTDAGDDAAAGQHVGGQQQLRRQHRRPMRHHDDRGQQLDALRAAGDERQRGDRIEALAGRRAGPHAVLGVGVAHRRSAPARSGGRRRRDRRSPAPPPLRQRHDRVARGQAAARADMDAEIHQSPWLAPGPACCLGPRHRVLSAPTAQFKREENKCRSDAARPPAGP